MQITQRTTRGIVLLAGGVMAVSSLHPAPARADKSSSYKAGAIGLGVAAGALILKGKTLPGVLAGVGAYYAYKKSQDTKRDGNYASYPTNGNYDQGANNGDARYPADNGGYQTDNGGYGRDANTGYDYNGDNGGAYNRNGDTYNQNNDSRDGGYRPADNQPTYNAGSNYPDNQTYGQTNNQTYQQTETSDASNYNPTVTSGDNGNEPNYGYRAFSQTRSARASRHGR